MRRTTLATTRRRQLMCLRGTVQDAKEDGLATFGLNEKHRGCVVSYLRFARTQRSQHLKSIDACLDQLKSSRYDLLLVSYALEQCNPWPHVANRHISVSQLLSL